MGICFHYKVIKDTNHLMNYNYKLKYLHLMVMDSNFHNISLLHLVNPLKVKVLKVLYHSLIYYTFIDISPCYNYTINLMFHELKDIFHLLHNDY